MPWYEWITVCSAAFCLGALLYQGVRLIRLGRPKDNAQASGNVGPAVRYSMTGAMNPAKKETAFLHLPTYIAGILYHLGTFLSVPLFLVIWFNLSVPRPILPVLAGFLAVSAGCGAGILIKRMAKRELRDLSNPDDFLANLLVTLFQAGTLAALCLPELKPVYFLMSSVLLLYIPVSKLRHVIYFFAARYHLGFFYGWRGVWPPGKRV